MSRARHKARENGGSVKQVWNAGGEQNEAKEAEGKELKRGGKAMHADGDKSKSRGDRPNRARGGRMKGEGVGANLTPLSTAARVKHITKSETDESGTDKVY